MSKNKIWNIGVMRPTDPNDRIKVIIDRENGSHFYYPSYQSLYRLSFLSCSQWMRLPKDWEFSDEDGYGWYITRRTIRGKLYHPSLYELYRLVVALWYIKKVRMICWLMRLIRREQDNWEQFREDW